MFQRIILNIYSRWFPNKHIICCAPTGRAARRMEQSTGYAATTAHKALGLTGGDLMCHLDQPEPLDADLVLCDEVSMLDMLLSWALLHGLPLNCRLILVGDADRLPSVGPSAVLRELISSTALPIVKLDKVFRQDEGSLVAENARRIRLGDTCLELNDRDFRFVPAADFTQAADLLVMQYFSEVRRYGVDHVALLTPYREKTATGARTINKRLRDIVNPLAPDKPELTLGQRIFRLGDKVMKNRNTKEVSNGDIGYYIVGVAEDGMTLHFHLSGILELSDDHDPAQCHINLPNVDRYTEIPELTPHILHEFIEKIVIYAATDPHSKVNRRQQVDIYYKGIGILEISKVFDTRHK